ncbi:hypothetical protein HDU96_000769 [Phlyctochytrium bullatum]|nr:hypothetical protein HDU96_000769 [Phlyctochytrium bullatum]
MKFAFVAGCVTALLASSTPIEARFGRQDPTGRIKRVVVLVLENRSFDHLLGFWARTRPNIDSLPANASNPLTTPSAVIPITPTSPLTAHHNPCGELDDVAQSIYGDGSPAAILSPQTQPTMTGFVDVHARCWNTTDTEVLREAVAGFAPEKVPVTTRLAEEFAVFDRWFASAPTETIPNRLFLGSATARGLTANKDSELLGFPQRSLYASLTSSGVSWKNYFGMIPTSLLFRDTRTLDTLLGGKLATLKRFYQDARRGRLPQVSFLDPVYGSSTGLPEGLGGPANDNHPPHDVARGEQLVKEVYEAVRNGPQWEETLLLITYDEHGGYYDHVPPPTNVPIPDAASANSTEFRFDRLGIRVPTIAISPWIKKGTVLHRPSGPTPTSEYEHSSLPATLKNLFHLPSFLTARDAWAGSFHNIAQESGLDAPRTDCPRVLPDPPPFAGKEQRGDEVLCELVEGLVKALKGLLGKVPGFRFA